MAEIINSQSKPIFIEFDDDTIEDAREEIHDKKKARLIEGSKMGPLGDGIGPHPASWPPMSVETVLKAEDRAQAKRMVANRREATPEELHEQSQARLQARRKINQEILDQHLEDAAKRRRDEKIANEYMRTPEYQAQCRKARREREEEDRIELENRAKARRGEPVNGNDWTPRPLKSRSTLMRERKAANAKKLADEVRVALRKSDMAKESVPTSTLGSPLDMCIPEEEITHRTLDKDYLKGVVIFADDETVTAPEKITTETPAETEPDYKAETITKEKESGGMKRLLLLQKSRLQDMSTTAVETVQAPDKGVVPGSQTVEKITTKPGIVKDPHKIEYLTPAQQAIVEEKWQLDDEAEKAAEASEIERACGDAWVLLSDYEIGSADRWE